MKKIVSLLALTSMLLISGLLITEAQKRPSNDIPLIVRIEGIPNDPGDYRIVSDGREYVDGQEGVYAKFQVDNGSDDFIMDPTSKSVSFPRALYFDFTDKIANGTIANPWSGQGLVKIDTYLNFRDVNTLTVGDTMTTVGGFGQLFSGGKKTTYSVAFIREGYFPGVVNDPNNVAYLEVTHPDCNTWVITPESVDYIADDGSWLNGPVAALVGVSNTAKSAGQYLMQFKITLERKNPLNPCP